MPCFLHSTTSILFPPRPSSSTRVVTPPRALSSRAPPPPLSDFSCACGNSIVRKIEPKAIGIARERESESRRRGSLWIGSNLAGNDGQIPTDYETCDDRVQVRSCTRVGVYEFVCKPPLDQPRFHYIPHRSSDYSRIKTRSKNLYKYIYIYMQLGKSYRSIDA